MVTRMHAFKQCDQWSCAPGRKLTRMYNCTIMIRPGFTFNLIQRSTKAKVLELSYTQIKWNYTGNFRINQSAGAEWLKFLVGFYILVLTNGFLSSNKPPTLYLLLQRKTLLNLTMKYSYTVLEDNTSTIDHCSCTDKSGARQHFANTIMAKKCLQPHHSRPLWMCCVIKRALPSLYMAPPWLGAH